MPNISQITAVLLACALTAGMATNASGAVAGADLPDLGNPSGRAMSADKAQRIGARVIANLHSKGLVLEDPQLVTFIRSIGQRLLSNIETNDQDVQYYVLKLSALNSFALPGGNIGIFTGMISETDNESELAALMAHETAHVVQHHIAREAEQMEGIGWQNLALILAGAIAGASTGNADAIPAAVSGGLTHLMKQRAGYTEAHEYEADRIGIKTLAKADFDPHAMVTLFQKFQRQRQSHSSNEILPTFLNHPLPGTRIAEAAERAVGQPKRKVRTSSIYPLMRERARIMQSSRMDKLRARYKSRIATGEANAANAYGYALTLMRLGKNSQAIDILTPYAQAHPNQAPWQLALASAEKSSGQRQHALKRLRQAKTRFPSNSAVKLAYASTLLAVGKPAAMRDFLLSQNQVLKQWPKAQHLLAKGANRQKRLGEAYYRRAKAYAMRGAYPGAINQLRSALQTAELNSYNKSRLSALRTQFARKCNHTYGTDHCRRAVEHLAKRNSSAG
ncbi:M48 family metalloprotease [Salinisphaera sp. USBA-960]|nr:M48 family metalloprotease [Salifodinibacter halophilus]NNC26176.1 M48 family metalloprotease [Salifodinibacter halophilus]